MTERIPAEVFPPGEFIREELEARGWSQNDLAEILGSYPRFVSEIIAGKRTVTPETAKKLGAAFGTDPQLWMNLESSYRLRRTNDNGGADIERKAKIFVKAPVREMQRRGWIKSDIDVAELESELKRFLGISSLDEEPSFLAAAARSNQDEPLKPIQIVWCVRARQLASALQVGPFHPETLHQAERELRELAAYPREARQLSKVLAKYGIRFVIVEGFPGGKIDGVTTWLDNRRPVIAVSVRFDRVDGFWHTVMHEFSHVRHGDALAVDIDIAGESTRPESMLNDVERRAHREAAASLVPQAQLESFIRRVGPLYSRNRVVQFAHTIQIHPGIVVGQLHRRQEVGYHALRDLLPKVRDIVTETALTDGWGKSISPGVL